MSNKKQDNDQSEIKNGEVIDYLIENSIDYEVTISYQNEKKLTELSDKNNISLSNILLGIICTDGQAKLLIVLQANMLLDITKVSKSLNRELVFADPKIFSLQAYYDEKLATYPPLPYLLGIKAIFDSNIKELLLKNKNNKIYFSSGQDSSLLSISADQFQKLHDTIWDEPIGINIGSIEEQLKKDQQFIVRRIRTRIKETFELPIMPPMADELLKLRVDPTANATKLAKIVAKDPSLSAQLISWSCSPYYGYPGKITSLDDAIIKVLGYDLVMNISLGIAIGQAMKIPTDGPIGLTAYWRQAIYAATLMDRLINIIPVSLRPYRGLGYLCGLLYNFGHLILGQIFLPQFNILNQLILINSHVPITIIEKYLFSIDHQDIGGWLMEKWHMPEELVITLKYHHMEDYEGKHADYVSLVLLVNRILSSKNIGDDFSTELPLKILNKFNLTESNINELFDDFWNNRASLDSIVDLLSG